MLGYQSIQSTGWLGLVNFLFSHVFSPTFVIFPNVLAGKYLNKSKNEKAFAGVDRPGPFLPVVHNPQNIWSARLGHRQETHSQDQWVLGRLSIVFHSGHISVAFSYLPCQKEISRGLRKYSESQPDNL
jgi:hypothetical protein